MAHELSLFLERHPLTAGWLGTLALFSADAFAALEQLNIVLSLCVRFFALVTAVFTIALAVHRWHSRKG